MTERKRRLTAKTKFEIYLKTRAENAPIGEVLSEYGLKNMLNIQLVLINTKQYTVSFEISSSLKEKIPSESAKYDTIMYGYATSAYHLGYYKLAKESCEYIIKNSTSPDFIKTAETYLDRIKSIE